MQALLFLMLALGIALHAERGSACASCGSGGDDPLVLYPNEEFKLYLGLSQSSGFANINADGTPASAGGPDFKRTLVMAGGYSFSPSSFVTLTVPLLQNQLGSASRTAIGDPSFGGRYALILASIAAPEIPQVQLLGGYRHAVSRSLRESRELTTLLDVFGSGFSELKLGVDVWWGMQTLKPGFSVLVLRPLAADYGGESILPGQALRTTVSLAYSITASLKITGGATREERAAMQVDSKRLGGSQQLVHSLFGSMDVMLDPLNMLRLGFSQQAAWGQNKNTSRSQSSSLAYMHAF